MPARIEVKPEGLTQAIAAYNGTRQRWQTRAKKTATSFGEHAVAFIQRRFRTGGTTATRTKVRSNKLRRAYRYLVRAGTESVELDLGVIRPSEDSEALQYAATQEFGATIKAKPGKALAIPLPAALTAAGVPRGRPRDFEDTFILKREGAAPLIVQTKGKGKRARIVPLFLLVKQVKVPPRPALAPTAKQLQPRFESALLADLRAAVAG